MFELGTRRSGLCRACRSTSRPACSTLLFSCGVLSYRLCSALLGQSVPCPLVRHPVPCLCNTPPLPGAACAGTQTSPMQQVVLDVRSTPSPCRSLSTDCQVPCWMPVVSPCNTPRIPCAASSVLRAASPSATRAVRRPCTFLFHASAKTSLVVSVAASPVLCVNSFHVCVPGGWETCFF